MFLQAVLQSSGFRMSPSIRVKFLALGWDFSQLMFSSFPVEKLSKPVTFWFWVRSSWTMFEPMNPAAPVIR